MPDHLASGSARVGARSCRRADVLIKARQTIGMKLRVGDRAALLLHPRLAKARARLKEPFITLALDHVLPGRQGDETSPGSVCGPLVTTWGPIAICACAPGMAETVIRHAAAKAKHVVLMIMTVISSR